MNATAKILLGLLLAAAATVGYLVLTYGPGDAVGGSLDPVAAGGPTPPDGEVAADRTAGAAAPGAADQALPGPVRVAAERGAASGTDYAQGIAGVVVDEQGRPVRDAHLYLMPGMGLASLRMFQQYQQGVRFAPVASTVTGADGRFRLGVKDWREGIQFDIRVLHADYCDAHVSSIQPQPEDWFEQDPIRLQTGVTVFGKVTNHLGVPIPNAAVYARRGTGHQDIAPPPGREHGKPAATDTNGNYELAHLDPKEMIQLRVEAANFATEERTDLNLHGALRHQVDFALSPGLAIAGTVVATQSSAIRQAKVTVAALDQKSQQTVVARTDGQGRFKAHGLRSGRFTVLVEADGYLSVEEKPVAAGTEDLTITLERTGSVFVTVRDEAGRPLRDYHYHLKAAFEGSKTYGNPLISNAVRSATDGRTRIDGIKPMTYVVEVQAKGFAKNFSERFSVLAGQQTPPEVTVTLNQGGSIRGIVVDDQGRPVKDVAIRTNPNQMVDNPISRMFQMSFTVTQTRTTTNAKGEFHFEQLYPASYQLVLSDQRYSTLVLDDIEVRLNEETRLDEIRVSEGCIVSGIAHLDGMPTGQIKIIVSPVSTDTSKPPPYMMCEAVSDNEGRFLLERRVPPGRYKVMAAENTLPNALIQMVQLNQSSREFVIRPGVRHHVLDVRVHPVK